MNDVKFGDPLTEEEKTILVEWERKREVRRKLYDQLVSSRGDEMLKIIEQIQNVDGETCEHGRSYYGTCNACTVLEIKTNPHYEE